MNVMETLLNGVISLLEGLEI